MLEKKQWGWKKSHKEDNGKQRRTIHVEEKKWETVWSSWGGRVKGVGVRREGIPKEWGEGE